MPHYLYFELLKLVRGESEYQLKKLEEDLNVFATQYPNDWDRLTKWDIPDTYDQVRQDLIPNGIASRYTYNQLSESSGAAFNSPKFYDYNQYLSQLVLLAQIVDDQLHESVQAIFQIDKVTKIGKINFDDNIHQRDDQKRDEKRGDGVIEYTRGPVKLIERARYKAQTDYANEPYPSSACVLDLNRCSLIFNDISTMLAALQLFVNKVRYYQSGSIIGIVRDKNGFIEYVKETQYADIKLNVLIKGTHNNIIGEVQFLLKTMKEFKDKAHNLYAIERQRETVESSVSKILPLLIDEDKQLFIAGNMGNVKSLCNLMVIHNKSVKDIMKIDSRNGQTILHLVCRLGHIKALKFIQSLLTDSRSVFVDHLFASNTDDYKPIELAVRLGQVNMIHSLFQLKGVKTRYENDLNLQYRLLFHVYRCTNTEIINFIIDTLGIKDQMHEIIHHRLQYPKSKASEERPTTAFHYYGNSLFCAAAIWNTVENFQHLAAHIKENEFWDYIFVDDMNQRNVIETIIQFDRFDLAKYLMSIKQIRDRYANNTDLLFRVVYFLFTKSQNTEMFDYVLKELDLNKAKIETCLKHKYSEPEEELADFAFDYHHFTILNRIIINERLGSLKKLAGILGEDTFCKHVIEDRNQSNESALETAAGQSQFEITKYLLWFKVVRDSYADDEDLIFRMMYYLFTKCDKDEMVDYVLRELNITKDKIQATLTHQCEAPEDGEFSEGASDYHLYSIVCMIVLYDKVDRLKKLRGIIGDDEEFAKGVFHRDGWGDNALETAVEQKFMDCIASLLEIECVRNKYMDEKDLLHPLLEKVNEHFDVKVCELLVKELKLTRKKLNAVKEYQDVDIDGILRVVNK